MAVSGIMIGLQILIIFVGSEPFSVVWLTGPQWAISLILGLLSLPIGALLRCIPDRPFQAVMDAVSGWTWRSSSTRPEQVVA